MGWFSSDSSTTPPPPKASTDGGFIAPDRSARAMCWEARDAFFHCLDEHSIIDSIKQKDKAGSACGQELQGFEKNCASSWVEYFKKRRVMEYQRDQTIKRLEADGAKTMGGPGTTGGSFGGGAPGR